MKLAPTHDKSPRLMDLIVKMDLFCNWQRDAASAPNVGDRVPYVIIKAAKGAKVTLWTTFYPLPFASSAWQLIYIKWWCYRLMKGPKIPFMY